MKNKEDKNGAATKTFFAKRFAAIRFFDVICGYEDFLVAVACTPSHHRKHLEFAQSAFSFKLYNNVNIVKNNNESFNILFIKQTWTS